MESSAHLDQVCPTPNAGRCRFDELLVALASEHARVRDALDRRGSAGAASGPLQSEARPPAPRQSTRPSGARQSRFGVERDILVSEVLNISESVIAEDAEEGDAEEGQPQSGAPAEPVPESDAGAASCSLPSGERPARRTLSLEFIERAAGGGHRRRDSSEASAKQAAPDAAAAPRPGRMSQRFIPQLRESSSGRFAVQNDSERKGESKPSAALTERVAARAATTEHFDSKSPTALVHYVATSVAFEVTTALLVLASGAFVGIETNYMAVHGGQQPVANRYLHVIFNLLFVVEFVMRCVGAGGTWFTDPKERRGNWAETFLAVFTVTDLVLGLIAYDNNTGILLRAMRLFRLIRLLRLIRMLKFALEFQRMIYAVISCARTLFFSLMMLFFVVYIFSLVFCQGATDYRFAHYSSRLLQGLDAETIHATHEEPFIFDPAADLPLSVKLREMYGSLPKAFYTLFSAASQGISWHYALEPMEAVSSVYVLGFLAYITLIMFGVMNVVTSVFVESAILSAQRNKDLIVQQKEQERTIAVQHMKDVFSEIDQDGSGEINMEEMEYFLTDPALKSYVEALGISADNTRLLFRLMDIDGSGNVELDEFCEGCMRLQGEAKSVDMHAVLYQVRQFLLKWSEFTAFVEERLDLMEDSIKAELPKMVSAQYMSGCSGRQYMPKSEMDLEDAGIGVASV